MNSVLFLLVCSLLIGESLAASALPSWVTNPNIDAGTFLIIQERSSQSILLQATASSQHLVRSSNTLIRATLQLFLESSYR